MGRDLNAKFYVGHTGKDSEKLLGNGNFRKYKKAVEKAEKVAKKDGNSRVVSPRGVALWTHDNKGLFQKGKINKEAKRFYRAEDGYVDMNSYASDYIELEDDYFNLGVVNSAKLGFGFGLGLMALSMLTGILYSFIERGKSNE
jgi:hypothetical protein